MAEYKDIHGTTVRNSAGNLAGAKTGELFYDSTNLDFKYQHPNVTTAGAWRTGGNMNTARYQLGVAGIQTSALAFGGLDPNRTAKTESYNGGSWTEVADLNAARTGISNAGASNTSALGFGGNPPGSATTGATETWDGSSWTEV